jgi:diaminohydroxyphosphoribosylaminopyrimidine deaminase/5-amino-6-(5-phosphoribosylamino)uracil reductase
LEVLLKELGKRGLIGVLVEGGGYTIESFFRQGLVDAIELHVAPIVLGSGRVWVDGVGVASLSESWKVKNLEVVSLGSGFRLTGEVVH